ncbi:bacteriohopanetetrol glucosamine biosynthesis glycosyltransferase HpnI [Telmatospirillum sp.]|uniref:bacteriohopanetetrol glucosamine biosynthesis glycosyltransferase HpnI n=1 Tax=Telmatospirillum sp. TaxID=2079197 RepID=UPI002847FFB4|nr:bacteriohopanetetrol glucosamine biosynthesis glycosyltransferase HpnI [Telmatospirillum sp.]MDR3439651.1 bacteriohopanetetrol glucosamine biosynthesis glycosyltransferase HpnI [Telmatospirillum sp.]
MPFFLSAAAWFLGATSIAGTVYQIAATRQLRRFLAQPRVAPALRPSVSIMKPLCGDEPHLADNLRSFCSQDYPDAKIVFGVADANDPALDAVQQATADLPEDRKTVVVDPRRHGCNLKIGNLLNMSGQARGDILVIADSDVRVEPDYLDDVVAPFIDTDVGLVTCLYVGRPVDGVWSRIGAMGLNHGFLPSALVAQALGRTDGCFGATMAVRRDLLAAIGGFAPLRDTLADDWALGAAVRSNGRRIALAARPVDIIVHEPDLGSLLAHEIRWGRTIAAIDRTSYMASVTTQPVALAALAVILGGAAWPFLAILAAAIAVRVGTVRSQERALRLPRAALHWLAVRDMLTFFVFVVACCGRSVIWRGRRFLIRRDGTLETKEGTQT